MQLDEWKQRLNLMSVSFIAHLIFTCMFHIQISGDGYYRQFYIVVFLFLTLDYVVIICYSGDRLSIFPSSGILDSQK